MEAGGPLSIPDSQLPDLLARLDGVSAVVLAVSGGPDSMALMLLTARWLSWRHLERSRTTPRCVVATVDHGLRTESAAEARFVSEAAGRLGFEHRTLVWQGEKPRTGIMETARAARYGLLRKLALELAPASASLVVTAHHEGDLAETFLMRLARGSGLDGLVGMLAEWRHDEAAPWPALHRPLLAVPKARLIATLADAGQNWIDDPSNGNTTFERARIRNAATVLNDLGLTDEAIGLSVRRLERALRAIEDQAGEAYARAVTHNDGTWATLRRETLLRLAPEIAIRLLQRCMTYFGGRGRPPDLSDVERLLERLRAPGSEVSTKSLTLAGCLIEQSADGYSLDIIREIGRDGLPAVAIVPGDPAVRWDNRFTVQAHLHAVGRNGTGDAMIVRGLGDDGLAAVNSRLQTPLRRPRAALLTLPSVWSGGELIAVPTLAPAVPDLDPKYDDRPIFTVSTLAPSADGC